MDPVSHVLFARTLIALDRHRRLGSGAIAACALGALAPDVDVVLIASGWDVYLRVHEIGSHSVLGSLAVASGGGGSGLCGQTRRPIRAVDAGVIDWRA